MKHTTTTSSTRAGRTPAEFANEAGIGRSTLYELPEDAKPRSVRIGARVVIVEEPRDWLLRIQARGGVETRRPGR